MILNNVAFTGEVKEGDHGIFLLPFKPRVTFGFPNNAPLWTQRPGQYNSGGHHDDDKWTEPQSSPGQCHP